jgi:integrase/recombinase XerD
MTPHALVPTEAIDSFETRSVPVAVVRADAPPAELARALLALAGHPVPLAYDALDRWWTQATGASRHALVFRLAAALGRIDSRSAAILTDARWRASVGIPLALATFVLSSRARAARRAVNTRRAQRSDWRVWRRWCKAQAKAKAGVRGDWRAVAREAFPAFNPSRDQLKAFLAWFGPRHKLASVQRWGASFTAMHADAGFANPLESPLNQQLWLGAIRVPDPKRAAPNDRRSLPVDQAEGLNRDELEQALAACDDSLLGLRDAALLAVTYDLLGRRSEVVALDAGDLKFHKAGDGVVTIRRSKTDQNAEGQALYLREDSCRRVQRWLARAQITEGAVFRSLRGFAGKGKSLAGRKRLPSAEVATIIRRRLATAGVFEGQGLSPAEIAARIRAFSGHSLRVGAAQDMVSAQLQDADILNAGRWKSLTMLTRYTRAQRAGRSAGAKLARKQAHDASTPPTEDASE